jgi:4-hydroxy 2-oxovalerate aldolase
VKSQTDVPLGFHGHNNLELALINTLTALDNGVEIVDATITGMGRGAGNLKTELLLTVLNTQKKLELDYNPLSQVVDEFAKMQKNYEWGTNLPYMVSGGTSLPQKQVMEWVSKRFYSFNSILRALNNQFQGRKDNRKLPHLDFEKEKSYEAALIVGGGPSVVVHSEAIDGFLEQHPNIVVIHASSRNALSFAQIPNDQFFCLVGNEGHRMEQVFGDASKARGKCVLPPYPRKMGTYIPNALEDNTFELSRITFTDDFKDTHTALAIQTALELSVNRLYIVGYDGYSGATIGQKEQEFFMENQYLFSQAFEKDLECISLTETKYNKLKQESIFSYI